MQKYDMYRWLLLIAKSNTMTGRLIRLFL